jgi:hypothetical protein
VYLPVSENSAGAISLLAGATQWGKVIDRDYARTTRPHSSRAGIFRDRRSHRKRDKTRTLALMGAGARVDVTMEISHGVAELLNLTGIRRDELVTVE